MDKEGQTSEFMLSAKRDVSAAKRFFKKLMRAERHRLPFSISVDKNAAYPDAFTSSQMEKIIPHDYVTNCARLSHSQTVSQVWLRASARGLNMRAAAVR